jgi:ketosteroid isomerase-like protein
MKTLCLVIWWCWLCSIAVQAQPDYRLTDYFPSQVGDEWQYKNLAPDGLSPIVIKVSARRTHNGQLVFQRDENNGDYRLQSHAPGQGLLLHQLYFTGDRIINYERPVVLLPETLQFGVPHKSQVKYTYLVKGEAQERGTQTYETKVVGLGEAATPLRHFKDCLLIRTTALRVDETGTQKGYELNEWHARGVGVVKVVGEIYWNTANGQRLRTFKINAALEKAIVNGQAIAGAASTATPKQTMHTVDSKQVARTLEVGTRGFEHFKVGLATGQWQPFLDMLTEDFTFTFPQGKYLGTHVGKDKATEFFQYVSQAFGKDGMRVTEVLRVTANETTIVFEFRDEGKIFGNAYQNRVAVSWDIRGDRIAGYREYFGSDGKSN